MNKPNTKQSVYKINLHRAFNKEKYKSVNMAQIFQWERLCFVLKLSSFFKNPILVSLASERTSGIQGIKIPV